MGKPLPKIVVRPRAIAGLDLNPIGIRASRGAEPLSRRGSTEKPNEKPDPNKGRGIFDPDRLRRGRSSEIDPTKEKGQTEAEKKLLDSILKPRRDKVLQRRGFRLPGLKIPLAQFMAGGGPGGGPKVQGQGGVLFQAADLDKLLMGGNALVLGSLFGATSFGFPVDILAIIQEVQAEIDAKRREYQIRQEVLEYDIRRTQLNGQIIRAQEATRALLTAEINRQLNNQTPREHTLPPRYSSRTYPNPPGFRGVELLCFS